MIKEEFPNNFNIKIENFGPIKNAEFNIKPLTVFTGPNNSGKSYSALLINALTYYFDGQQYSTIPNIFWRDLTFKSLERGFDEISKGLDGPKGDCPDSYKDLTALSDIRHFSEKKPEKSEKLRIPKGTINCLIKLGLGKFYTELLEEKIKSTFGTDLKNLIQYGKNYFKISENDDIEFRYVDNTIKIIKFPEVDFKLLENNLDPNVRFKIDGNDVILNLDYQKLAEEFENPDFIPSLILLEIYNLVGKPILKKLYKNASYYMPAARSEVMQNYKSFVSNTIRNKDTSLPGVITDFAATIGDLPEEKTIFYDLTEEFESEIIGGNILMDPSKDFSEIYYENKNFQIPISLTSSSIWELTPIFLYLKRIVKKGDTLIIDEPEAHLHPKNQRIFVKYLVRLVNKGLNIIITTHSDYILEQISNFILLSKISRIDRAEMFEYEVDDILEKEKVGLYLFKQDSSLNYVTEEMEITDQGIPDTSFTPIIEELYDESSNIKEYLFG
jgi:predicted ATPase